MLPSGTFVLLVRSDGDTWMDVQEVDASKLTREDFLGHEAMSPEQMMIEQEKLEEFKKRLQKNLSGMENEVLNYYLEGNNYTQIADIMGKSPKAIDNALQRIRQKIKRK